MTLIGLFGAYVCNDEVNDYAFCCDSIFCLAHACKISKNVGILGDYTVYTYRHCAILYKLFTYLVFTFVSILFAEVLTRKFSFETCFYARNCVLWKIL